MRKKESMKEEFVDWKCRFCGKKHGSGVRCKNEKSKD